MKSPHEQGLERLVFFSDAVIAIAITLLVLELRLPEGPESVGVRLGRLIPGFISFFVSFSVIGIFWEAHHRMFSYIRRYDRGLLWLNLLFLMFIAFMPFPTALIGEHWPRAAILLYTGTLTATGLSRAALWRHAVTHRLVDPGIEEVVLRTEALRAMASPVIFLLSAAVAMFRPALAPLLWLLLAPVLILGRRRIERRYGSIRREPPAAAPPARAGGDGSGAPEPPPSP